MASRSYVSLRLDHLADLSVPFHALDLAIEWIRVILGGGRSWHHNRVWGRSVVSILAYVVDPALHLVEAAALLHVLPLHLVVPHGVFEVLRVPVDFALPVQVTQLLFK